VLETQFLHYRFWAPAQYGAGQETHPDLVEGQLPAWGKGASTRLYLALEAHLASTVQILGLSEVVQ
jgi:hypothetical protein